MPWYLYGYLEADIIIGLEKVLRGDAGRELVALPAQVSVLKGEGAPRELVCWQGDAMGIGGQPPAEVHICSLHGTLLHHHVHIYLGLILLIGLGHDLQVYHQASYIDCYCHDYCFHCTVLIDGIQNMHAAACECTHVRTYPSILEFMQNSSPTDALLSLKTAGSVPTTSQQQAVCSM